MFGEVAMNDYKSRFSSAFATPIFGSDLLVMRLQKLL
jgi:hypothetical protein